MKLETTRFGLRIELLRDYLITVVNYCECRACQTDSIKVAQTLAPQAR